MARGRHPTRLRVKKPDEHIAEQYLLRFESRGLFFNNARYPRISSSSLFNNNHPLGLDIGCGGGDFACRFAADRAESNILGIDASQKPLWAAIDTAATGALNNIKFAHGDINFMLPLLQPASIDTVFYLFPNPPVTQRHWRKVVFSAALLDTLHSALVPGGIFFVASDAQDYFDYMYDLTSRDLRFCMVAPEEAKESWEGVSTYYEQVWERKGRQIFRMILRIVPTVK